MSDLSPRGETLRRAVRFVSERREEEPEVPLARWLEEAARRFDLGPLQAEYLVRFFRGEGRGDGA